MSYLLAVPFNLEREGVHAHIVGHFKVDTTDGCLHVSDETPERAVKVLNTD